MEDTGGHEVVENEEEDLRISLLPLTHMLKQSYFQFYNILHLQ